MAEGDDDIIAAVIAEANIVTDVNKWVVDSGATRHICATKDAFTSYTTVGDGEEHVYLGDSLLEHLLNLVRKLDRKIQ